MNDYLDIQETRVAGEPCLAVSGSLDLYSGPTMRQALSTLMGREAPRLWLDLSQVSHLDSDGLALLLQAMAHQRRHQRRLLLGPVSDRVRKILGLVRLDFLLEAPLGGPQGGLGGQVPS